MNTRFRAALTLTFLTVILGTSTAAPRADAFFGDNFPELNEIQNFQCVKVLGKDELRISGDFSRTRVPIATKLVLRRYKQVLMVLVRVALPPEGMFHRKVKGSEFEYQFKIPRGVNQAVFGRQKRVLWNREIPAG